MFKIKYEPQFKKDYKKFKKKHPELIKDFRETVDQLFQTGKVEADYDPHVLDKQGGNYSNYYEYHLMDGKVDVIVIYRPQKSNPVIRLVRIGNHKDLFQGKEK